MYVCTYVTVKKKHHLYVLRSTGNAYDVIRHHQLPGPRAPPNIFTPMFLAERDRTRPTLEKVRTCSLLQLPSIIRLFSEHQSIPADKMHSEFAKRWRHRTVENVRNIVAII